MYLTVKTDESELGVSFDGGNEWRTEYTSEFYNSNTLTWENIGYVRLPIGALDPSQILVRSGYEGNRSPAVSVSDVTGLQELTILPLASHWNGSQVNLDTSIFAWPSNTIGLDAEGIIHLKNPAFDKNNPDLITYDIHMNISDPINNFNVSLPSTHTHVYSFNAPGWSANTNSQHFNISAFTTASSSLSGDVKLGTASFTLPYRSLDEIRSMGEVNFSLPQLGEGAKIGSLQLQPLTQDFSLPSDFSIQDPDYTKDLITGLTFPLISSYLGPDTRTFIDSADSLLSMRMALGIIHNDDLINPSYQQIAADADGNGLVQAADAWLINKYVATNSYSHIESSKVGEWQLYDSSTSSLASSQDDWLKPSTQFTAVLIGDVDGTFSTSF